MERIELTDDEQSLCLHVARGEPLVMASDQRIRGEVIRRIVLGLPFDEDKESLGAAIREMIGAPVRGNTCPKTPVGISISGGTIDGPLVLAAAIGADGGPMCPLEFYGCRFEGPVVGSYGRFARLAFRSCTFGGPGDSRDVFGSRRSPAIDLSGATILSDLDMADMVPGEEDSPLWVRAPGIRVEGKVDLSRCRLRGAPETREDVLNLTLAQIDGDLHFLGSETVAGRFSLRGARIAGDVWMSGASVRNPGAQALFLQMARINGFLMMNGLFEAPGGTSVLHRFSCEGEMKLEAAEVGRSIYLKDAVLAGGLEALTLSVRDDLILDAQISGPINLGGSRIGGSIDMSGLHRADAIVTDSFKDAQIGSAFKLAPRTLTSPPFLGEVDLRNVTCDMLDDEAGRCWGSEARLLLDHFVYRRTTWEPEGGGRRSLARQIGDFLLRTRLELFSKRKLDGSKKQAALRRRTDHWRPWQIRRNWIYQQFPEAAELRSPSRHAIKEYEYKPQPFQQAIEVARAEGHDEYAAQFEMRKRGIEWRLFNLENRWALGVVGILLACAWLLAKRGWEVLPPVAAGFVLVLALMYLIEPLWRGMDPWYRWVRVLLLGLGFTLIVLAVFFAGGWEVRPLQFAFALIIFTVVRLISWISNALMRFMFGYLRRPVRAIGSLIVAFLIGWAGVDIAKDRGMLVIDAEPVAGYAAPAFVRGEQRVEMGSQNVASSLALVRNVPCGEAISEPLYALDVLVPLIDLRQESQCEVGRARIPPGLTGMSGIGALAVGEAQNPTTEAARGALASLRTLPWPARIGRTVALAGQQVSRLPDSVGFWEVMKALYAIAGWFIVSLSILTFAHANKARGDPS